MKANNAGTGIIGVAIDPAISVPLRIVEAIAAIIPEDEHRDHGPSFMVCHACGADLQMKWGASGRENCHNDIKHEPDCPAEWARNHLKAQTEQNEQTEIEASAEVSGSRQEPVVMEPGAWECPACRGEITMGDRALWCGKNLQCPHCGRHHYYSEHLVLNGTTLNLEVASDDM